MSTGAQHGYLVLADISGYTSFMAGTELEHAHDVVAELLELVVKTLTPALTLSKLEGDAVFAYTPESRFTRGEALLELIETCYIAFRDHLSTISHRTTCDCNACRAVPTLDLKFLTHHGDYAVQQVAGTNELAGSAVNLAHRLLKNHVKESTGWQAYALFTASAAECLRLSREGMHVQQEQYEHLGEVVTYSLDLHARYREITETRRVMIEREQADLVLTQDVAAPPAVVWDWLNDPRKRTQWMVGTTWTPTLRVGGRTGTGARNHCAHGKDETVEAILDWRPFDYVTCEMIEHNNEHAMMTQTIDLETLPEGRGTRVNVFIKLGMPLPKFLRRSAAYIMIKKMLKYDQDFKVMAAMVSAHVSSTDAA
jgi:uncharacterized protein YndB with AHSA1/START domain